MAEIVVERAVLLQHEHDVIDRVLKIAGASEAGALWDARKLRDTAAAATLGLRRAARGPHDRPHRGWQPRRRASDLARTKAVAHQHDVSAGIARSSLADAARRLIFLKGNNAHDYKFSSAVLEDYHHLTPPWRDRFLAASVFNLKGSGAADNELVKRTREALNG